MIEIRTRIGYTLIVRKCDEDDGCVVVEKHRQPITRKTRIAAAKGPQREDPFVRLDAAVAELEAARGEPEPDDNTLMDDMHIPADAAKKVADAIRKLSTPGEGKE